MKHIRQIILTLIATTLLLCGCATSNDGTVAETTNVSNTGKTEYNTLIYDTLQPNEQRIYDQMVSGIMKSESSIKVSGTDIEVETVYKAIISDRPEFFYVDGYVYNTRVSILNTKGVSEGTVHPNYIFTQDEARSYLIKAHENMDTIFCGINNDMSSYEKSKYIFERLAFYGSYNKNAKNGNNILSTYVNNNGTKGEGYAQAYTYALQRYGIPCATVLGLYENAEHSWNVTKIDSNYYLCDITNGDATYINSDHNAVEYVNYSFFNMLPDHTKYYSPESIFTGFSFVSMDNNYYVKELRYFDSYSPDLLGKALKGAYEDGEEVVTLAFSSVDVMNESIEKFFNNNGMAQYVPSQAINYISSGKLSTLTFILSEDSALVIEDEVSIENELEIRDTRLAHNADENSMVMYYYSLIPENVRDAFEASDWTWYVYEDGPLNEVYGYKNYITGITSWNAHEIVIDRKESSQNAIIHEIGHWANHYYRGGLDSALLFSAYYHEWEDLYREFGGSELNYNMPEEFAASAFDYYVTEPERMKAVAPETYKMISSFVGYKK